MSEILNNFPLFPINVIIFPGEIQPLHIFEPRYKQLIREVEASEGTFGIPFITDGKVCQYGSVVKLHKILATSPTGEMDILVKGVNVFNVLEMEEQLQGKPYGGGTVQISVHINTLASEVLMDKFNRYRHQLESINKSATKTRQHAEPLKILEIAGQMPLEVEEKYTLLNLSHQTDREHYLIEKLDFLSLINKKLEEVGYRFYLN
jgi:uncharacterized protein